MNQLDCCVTKEANEKLPNVLVEYLWNLAQAKLALNVSGIKFRLYSQKQAFGLIQNICFGSENKTVFGFEPVDGNVIIENKNNKQLIMSFEEQKGWY